MKIGVCFKIVPEYESLASEEWSDVEQLDFTYSKKVYGCFDESALEMALILKDRLVQAEHPVELVAVTAGVSNGAATDGLLRGVLAAGFQDVVILPATEPFQPRQTAKALAGYFQKNPVDLILTGRMVGPGDSGMVPVYLSEELGFTLFMNSVSVDYHVEEDRVELICKDGQIMKTFSVPKGAVCTVGDAVNPYLRLFPLKARMEAKKKEFIYWDEVCEAQPEAVLLSREEMVSDCRYLKDMELDEVAEKLLDLLSGEGSL